MEPLNGRAAIQELTAEKRQKVCSVLQQLIFTEEQTYRLTSTLEEQINLANSPKESDQKNSDLWWGYTFVNGVLEGNEEQTYRLTSTLEEQINLANSPKESDQKNSDLWWGYTFVNGVLEGNETGKYLGLDLGSTNLRVVLVKFTDGVSETKTKYYNISQELLTGPCEKVFDEIASSLKEFLLDTEVRSETTIPLGFTFSFPATQTSLKHCTLNTWTTGFKCTTGVGLDPCILLEEAISRHGGLSIPVNVVARIGDSTGTLISSMYRDKQCVASLILGTGSNVCIVEEKSRYQRINVDDQTCEKILVDLEWGALGDNGCCDFYRNEFEREVDKYSSYPGSYTFEKSFSGMYIGELFRLCLLKLTTMALLFDGKVTKELSTRWSLEARSVAAVESDKNESDVYTMKVLKDLSYETATGEDIYIVKTVCALVSERGAYIVASALALILKRMNKTEISVGIDGSLYEHHTNYHSVMTTVLQKLLPDVKVKLFLNKDGSGEGAAFVAAIATNRK